MSIAALRRRRVVLAGSGGTEDPGGGDGGSPVVLLAEDYRTGVRHNANGVTGAPNSSRVTIASGDSSDGDGYHLAVRCGPNGPTDDGEQADLEEVWNLGQYVTEWAHEFWMKVPSNFTHRKRAGYTENNKLWQWFRDTYSDLAGGTQQLGAEFEAVATNGNSLPQSTLKVQMRNPVPGGYLQEAPGASSGIPFIGGSGPVVLDTWTRIRMYAKVSSAFGVADGIYKIWAGSTLLYDGTGLNLHNTTETPSDTSFINLKFFGSSNSGYVEETTFKFDAHTFILGNPGW